MDRGVYGPLESCDPPITVPAWSCMTSSKDPGTLGFYGFRNRKDHSYDGLTFATAEKMKEDRVWDILSRVGKHVVVLGVPQTFPPRRVNGEMISCFLAPSTDSKYTYPEELRDEIKQVVGEYMVDVPNFRTDQKDRILRDINEMTKRRFQLARHLRDSRPWDFFMMVEMGTDRLHHGFWRYYDHGHPDYVPGTAYEQAFRDYYRYLDSEIGSLIEGLGDGHRADGGLRPRRPVDVRRHPRERVADPRGLPDAARGRAGRAGQAGHDRLAADAGVGRRRLLLAHLPERARPRAGGRDRAVAGGAAARRADREAGGAGRRAGQLDRHEGVSPRAALPHRQRRPARPDLSTSATSPGARSARVGDGSIHTRENDTGPDDANHAKYGIYIFEGPGMPAAPPQGARLFDIAPTVLELMGQPVPADMQGRSLAG